MRTSGIRRSRARNITTAGLGLLLVGISAFPAHAESIRAQQWHLDIMHAEDIWKISKGEGVTVAVIDSGVDDRNPDLLGQVLDGKDLALDEKGDEHTDYDGHGTGMAGLIAGTGRSGGGDGAFGLAPAAKILPIRVSGAGVGKQNKEDGEIDFNRAVPEAIRYAADSKAKVINVSMGSGAGFQQLTDAVKYALDKGALIFAAVGNSAAQGNGTEYPAATPGVVGVGAIDKKLTRTKESQYGPQVDLVAPGENMVHACGGSTGLCESHGTSGATALASASAALIWAKHPDWTNNQVLKVMLNTVAAPDDGAGRNDYIGYGAIRPLRALKTPGDPGPADVRPIPDLPAAQPATPSAAPSTTNPAPAPAPAPQASAGGGGNTGLWIGLGVGAALLIGGAVATAVVRSRRRSVAGTPAMQPAAPVAPPYAPPGPSRHGLYEQPPNSSYGPPPGPGQRS
ncbi:type VII secretion-associated serine protease mycosin [Streptomyces roseicoloratus]|uniref:Type VII secretion-associated serine protease mycosin n=1 Tax=Streptomyces roseicoloratus TaxID=2508722 RepID=A0ABY9RW91_9ACTN|nr:type VII secretion-associated serine protease mycosin [Streptomyces roseicoloratus]WMX45958.1 type VII secretion-associated serine protease mycosin [Streptomyces roseicoloratus]